MPHFIYKVRDKEGREKLAAQEANSEEEVVARLQNQGLLIISIVRQQEETEKKISARFSMHTNITVDDMIVFSRQLATLLEAGVTLLKSLDVLSRQTESRKMLKAVREIKQDIAGGSTFRDALSRHPEVFSDFWVNMVETGEASGALSVALSQLANYIDDAAQMRRKVGSALVYPIMLVGMSAMAMLVFTVWIVPIFAKVFEGFNVELPFITKAVMGFSYGVRKYFLLFIVSAVVGIYLLRKYLKTEKAAGNTINLNLGPRSSRLFFSELPWKGLPVVCPP